MHALQRVRERSVREKERVRVCVDRPVGTQTSLHHDKQKIPHNTLLNKRESVSLGMNKHSSLLLRFTAFSLF